MAFSNVSTNPVILMLMLFFFLVLNKKTMKKEFARVEIDVLVPEGH